MSSFSQIGSVVGNVVGSYFGGSVGGAIGGAIGGYVGAGFDPAIVNAGPRLGDSKLQDGGFGTPIAISFGSVRIAGTVMFETKIREHYKRQSVGKGGQKVFNDTYTYDFDFAVVLTDQHGRPVRGIKGIRRIWANGELIYSAAENATLSTLIASGQFCDEIRFYLGTDDQMPDPTIEAACGAGNVSAYRGYAYAVFRGAKATQTGQPAPQMEFEVVQDGVETVGKQIFARYTPEAPELPGQIVTWSGADRAIALNHAGSYFDSNVYIHKVVAGVDQVEDHHYIWPAQVSAFAFFLVNCSTHPYAAAINFTGSGYGSSQVLEIWDCDTGLQVVNHILLNGDVYYSNTGSTGRVAFEEATGYYATGRNGAGASYYYGTHIAFFLTGNPVYCELPAGRAMMDLAIYLGHLYVINSDGTRFFLNVYADTGAMLYEWVGPLGGGNADGMLCVNEFGVFTLYSGFVYRYAAEGAILLCNQADAPTGTVFGSTNLHNQFWTNGQIANIGFRYVTTPVETDAWTIQFKAIAKTTIPVGEAVAIIANIAGLDVATEVDVAQLTTEMRGYSFKKTGPASSFIEPLATCFFFEGYESEGKVKFAALGGPVARRIPFDDLAYSSSEDPVDPFPLVRVQEKDLPRSLSLTYSNPGADYQTGAEPPARRLTTTSVNDIQLEMPIVFTSQEAAERQDILLYKAWTERSTRKIALSRKHVAIEPTDVLEVEYPRGTWSRWRTRHIENQGPVLGLDLVADEPNDLVSSAIGGNPQAETTTLPLPSPTLIEFVDSPIFSDEYNDAGFYVALGGQNADWRGAGLLRSVNGTTFDVVDSVGKTATIGTMVDALPDYTGVMPFDKHATARVRIRTFGTPLTSATDEQLVGDPSVNAAIIGSEIVQFRTATLVAGTTSTWDLAGGIVRGLRGTEWAIGSHVAGERFVLIKKPGVLRVNFGAADLYMSRLYKAVSVGTVDSPAQPFSNTGMGLKPFAPTNLGAAQNSPRSDVLLSFERRTRLQVNQVVAGGLPLGELEEKYEIEISGDPSFTHIVRTIAATVSPAIYPLRALGADKAAGLLSPFFWRVFQLSEVVGRGFASAVAAVPFAVAPGAGGTGDLVAQLPFSGMNGSAEFVDDTGRLVTKTGFPIIDTSQSVTGGASGYFFRSRLNYQPSPDFNVLSADVSIFAAVRFKTLTQPYNYALSIGRPGHVSLAIEPYLGAMWGGPAFAPIVDYWYRFEIRIEARVPSVYINRRLVANALPRGLEPPTDADALYIGGTGLDGQSGWWINGWVDEVKMLRGTLPAPDAAVPHVALELFSYGPDGSTAFSDGADTPGPVVLSGGVNIQSYAAVFNGGVDWIEMQNSAALNVAGEDFVLEMQVAWSVTPRDMVVFHRPGSFTLMVNVSALSTENASIALYLNGISEPVMADANFVYQGAELQITFERRNSTLLVNLRGQGGENPLVAMRYRTPADLPTSGQSLILGNDRAGKSFVGSIRQARMTRFI